MTSSQMCFSYTDVRLVHKMLAAAFGDEQHALKQEECPIIFGTMDLEGPFQDHLSVGSEVRTLPVEQERLDLLRHVNTY